MRWGIRDEALDDHTTTEICLSEIENCKKLSVGPNFMVSNFELNVFICNLIDLIVDQRGWWLSF